MNPIETAFHRMKASGRCALIPYLMAGFPDNETFAAILEAAQAAGADLIEVGIPFSDPIADGPVIQAAGAAALKRGTHLKGVLSGLKKNRSGLTVPLVIMSYANPILRFGIDAFIREAAAAGVSGLVIPDWGPEEGDPTTVSTESSAPVFIRFITPATSAERIRDVAAAARGFIYLISVTGVTGARPGERFEPTDILRIIRTATSTPVCIGFGISGPEQASALSGRVDGVIIGSALIERIQVGPKAGAPARVHSFLRELRAALDEKGDTPCASS